MSFVFTNYIRSYEPGTDPVDPRIFEAFWEKLRTVLIHELKRRSLLTAPPTYLGVYGYSSWAEKDALEELLVDCYTFTIARPLVSLKALLADRDNIEGVVFRNIHNFFYNTQKKHDPLGFRVFVVLQAAVERALAAGEVHVLEGGPKIGNELILGLRPHADPAQAWSVELTEQVQGWNDDLLPDLVTARGKERDQVAERLARRLAELKDQGIEAFRFKDLIDPIKLDARKRWAAIWQQQEGPTAIEGEGDGFQMVWLVPPDPSVLERQFFERLLTCVEQALGRLETRPNTRVYLWKLWLFLKNFAAEAQETTGNPAATKVPSRRKIAKLLGIPRERLADLHETLGQKVEECRAIHSGKKEAIL